VCWTEAMRARARSVIKVAFNSYYGVAGASKPSYRRYNLRKKDGPDLSRGCGSGVEALDRDPVHKLDR